LQLISSFYSQLIEESNTFATSVVMFNLTPFFSCSQINKVAITASQHIQNLLGHSVEEDDEDCDEDANEKNWSL